MAQVAAPPRQSWDLGIGHEIDRSLVVIGSLGGGSRYEVFRAWDRELFCQVAVKVMRPHRVQEDRVMDGFEREISIASRLQHPNLVRLLRWSAASPRPYMVLEYVTAQTVAGHLESIGEAVLIGVAVEWQIKGDGPINCFKRSHIIQGETAVVRRTCERRRQFAIR